MTIKPAQGAHALTVDFTRAVYAMDPSGEDRIVLQSDPIDRPPTAPPGQPLPAVTSPPLWQVMVIELHWRTPAAGARDFTVADNAVLQWYVYGKPDGEGATSLLHYTGSGAVSVSADKSGAGVSIKNLRLQLAEQHGNLHDPLVDFRLSGSFYAPADPHRMQLILDRLHSAIGDAEQEHPSTREITRGIAF